MTDFAKRLNKVATNPSIFLQYGRGVERETLRYYGDGQLALTPHPSGLGSALTNKWVTTDYSESLLEFITPVSHSVTELMGQLADIHHFTQKQMGNEKLWPLSMPCFVADQDDIPLAQYGSSNNGRMKTLYRQGLKQRYGSLMQVISGVHFNFSFPDSFWDSLLGEQTQAERQDSKSDAYFGLIRNYYRFGWMIPFFFGASPALCSSFVKDRESTLPFENINGSLFLPNATALRLSDLGYTNSAQSELKIGFNSIDEYLTGLNAAIRTPSDDFAKLGVKENGEYRQLNSNVLQIENELYAPIRPKRVARPNEKPSQALQRAGVEYIEVRSLDVNPFSSVGVTKEQVRFLDLFLTWSILSDSDPMDSCEQKCWHDNWEKVILEGRKPGLELQIGCSGEKLSLQTWAHRVFDDLEDIAKAMDAAHGSTEYIDVCHQLRSWIDAPEQTISGRLLEYIKKNEGMKATGDKLGSLYKERHLNHQYSAYSEQLMQDEAQRSTAEQKQIEDDETVEFEPFLNEYFSYLNK